MTMIDIRITNLFLCLALWMMMMVQEYPSISAQQDVTSSSGSRRGVPVVKAFAMTPRTSLFPPGTLAKAPRQRTFRRMIRGVPNTNNNNHHEDEQQQRQRLFVPTPGSSKLAMTATAPDIHMDIQVDVEATTNSFRDSSSSSRRTNSSTTSLLLSPTPPSTPLPTAMSSNTTSSRIVNSSKKEKRKNINAIAYVAYLCNVLAVNLPIILLPLAAHEFLGSSSGAVATATKTVAKVSSMATLGGAFGKFVNGFICQRFGSYACSRFYLVGMAVSLGLFSCATTPALLGGAYFGMEFCASIQWTSLAIMLTNYYTSTTPITNTSGGSDDDNITTTASTGSTKTTRAKQLAVGLTAIGLASPAGSIGAKVMGAGLASFLNWRQVARMGCLVALLGSFVISQAPQSPAQKVKWRALQRQKAAQPWGSWITISAKDSAQALLRSKLFWKLSLAHSMAFVVRGIDRILGIFFSDMTGLPGTITGALTLSSTLGLLYGLVSASKTFPTLDVKEQEAMLQNRYMGNLVGALGLTGVAAFVTTSPFLLSQTARSLPMVQAGIASALAIFSGIFSANVSFQFYQFPTMIAKSFGQQHREVCISWMDAIGFLLAAPVFASIGQIVPTLGWVPAWSGLSILFGFAWILMLRTLPPILAKEKQAIQGGGAATTAA